MSDLLEFADLSAVKLSRKWLAMRSGRLFSMMALSALFVSCASERTVTYDKPQAQGLEKYKSEVKFVADEAGNVRPNVDKRSQFESQGAYAATKDFGGKDYAKEAYRTKRWGGDRQFDAAGFSGNTDASKYKHSPYFVQKQAAVQSERVEKQDYAVSEYGGYTGQVSRGREQARPVDAETDARRNTYPAPPVYSLREANGIGVSDTNAMLGR